MAKNLPHIIIISTAIKQAMTIKICLKDRETLLLAYNKEVFYWKAKYLSYRTFAMSIIVTSRLLRSNLSLK